MDNLKGNISKAKLLVLTALLFAIALILSIVENSLPSLGGGIAGVKLGLSNIAVMYALFFIDKREAFIIAVLKSAFVFITRGPVSALLSFSGGVLSIVVMVILIYIYKDRVSYLLLSIFGAVAHNLGQFAVVSLIYTGIYLWFYIPILLIAGVIAGMATSVLLRFILPALKRLV